MNKCKALKNKTDNIQCINKIKNGHFCGKHKNTTKPYFDDNGLPITTDNLFNHILPAIATNNISKDNISKDSSSSSTNELMDNTLNSIINKDNKPDGKSDGKLDGKPDNSNYNIFKDLETSNKYNEYLNIRKNYIKDNTKHIELIEFIENNKLDYYPNNRILASVEYYKLLTYKNSPNKQENAKFITAINNIALLGSFFETLLRVNLNLKKILRLQKWIKRSLLRYNIKLHGNALYNRALCVNDTDFVSLDEIKDIPDADFVSIKDTPTTHNNVSDTSHMYYGFHIDSISELIFKMDENYIEHFKKHSNNLCYRQYIRTLFNHFNKIKINNPYTRSPIDGNTKLNVIKLYTRRIFIKKKEENNNLDRNRSNNGMNVGTNGGGNNQDMRTLVRNKCFAVFQKIDMLGYFTDISWLLDINPKVIKLFYKKLSALWNFEFGLNNTARYKISKSHNLFSNINEILISRADKYVLLDKVLDVVNVLVSNGETDADRNSGCILVLYGLAFINPRCIASNPWLG